MLCGGTKSSITAWDITIRRVTGATCDLCRRLHHRYDSRGFQRSVPTGLGRYQTEISNRLRKNALILPIARLTRLRRRRGRDSRILGQRSTSSFRPSLTDSESTSKAHRQPHTKHSLLVEEFKHWHSGQRFSVERSNRSNRLISVRGFL